MVSLPGEVRVNMPGRRTIIRASHIVAYQDGGHQSLRDGVIVIEGNTIRMACGCI